MAFVIVIGLFVGLFLVFYWAFFYNDKPIKEFPKAESRRPHGFSKYKISIGDPVYIDYGGVIYKRKAVGAEIVGARIMVLLDAPVGPNDGLDVYTSFEQLKSDVKDREKKDIEHSAQELDRKREKFLRDHWECYDMHGAQQAMHGCAYQCKECKEKQKSKLIWS